MTIAVGSATARTQWTITAVTTGPWTIAGWMFTAVAPGGALIKVSTAAGGAVIQGLSVGSAGAVTVTQGQATTSASFVASGAWGARAWSCFVGTYDDVSQNCNLFVGSRDSPMRQSNGVVTTGNGARTAGGVTLLRSDSGDPVNGNFLGPSAMDLRIWSLQEAELFRVGGWRPQVGMASPPIAYVPYTNSATVDQYAGTGTTTGTMTLLPGMFNTGAALRLGRM